MNRMVSHNPYSCQGCPHACPATSAPTHLIASASRPLAASAPTHLIARALRPLALPARPTRLLASYPSTCPLACDTDLVPAAPTRLPGPTARDTDLVLGDSSWCRSSRMRAWDADDFPTQMDPNGSDRQTKPIKCRMFVLRHLRFHTKQSASIKTRCPKHRSNHKPLTV